MINRSYLPYKSARQYVDRGMAKWMGFFISEHTTAINTQGNTIDFSINMDIAEKLYTTKQIAPFLGKVTDCQNDYIYFTTKDTIIQIDIKDILKVSIAEELDYE